MRRPWRGLRGRRRGWWRVSREGEHHIVAVPPLLRNPRVPVDGFERCHRLAYPRDDAGERRRFRPGGGPGQQPVQGRGELRTGGGVAGRDLHARLGRGEQREVLADGRGERGERVAREAAVEDDDHPVGAGVAQFGHDVVPPGQGVHEGVVPVPGDARVGEHQVEVAAVGAHDAVPREVDDQQAGHLVAGSAERRPHPQRIDGPGTVRLPGSGNDDEIRRIQHPGTLGRQCLGHEAKAVPYGRQVVPVTGVGLHPDEHGAVPLGSVLLAARVVRRHGG